MLKRKNNIPHDFNNMSPIITPNDVISGFIFILVVISLIVITMLWLERNNNEVMDKNVHEESLQHLNPPFP